jgi:hypothetical protein
MRKVFLYLYPIFEYQRIFILSDKYYANNNVEHPLIVLNDCIKQRYKDKGYEVIIANYPDKEIYGISNSNIYRVIETDVAFKDASGYREDGSEKPIEEVKYPSEQYLLEQVGCVDEIIIGGYHAGDCVKKVAEHFYNSGVNTMIDIELTDFLFHLYKQPYFKKELYNPANYKQYSIALGLEYGESMEEIIAQLDKQYKSPIYKFDAYQPTIELEEILENIQTRMRTK